MSIEINRYRGQDVLPWFAEVSETSLEPGTRLYSFRSYHEAPEGTRVRLGRKNGIGQPLTKRGGAWWIQPGSIPAGNDGLTAYGMENRPSYVEPEKGTV